MYALAVLLMLNIIIVVHEFGHFITAKAVGIKTKTFAIGFGKTLWQHKGKDGVAYRINLLPLGGYCDYDMKEFHKKEPWKKFWVLFNGVFFNFILALIIAFIFVLLVQMPLDYKSSVVPAYDGSIGTILLYTWQSVINTINIILDSLLDLIVSPNFGSIMGPIQLITQGSAIIQNGLILALPLFIMIDINIMLFNAIPFPALDGGRIVFTIIEIVTQRKFKHEEKVHLVGLIVLMLFMIFVVGKDIFTVFIK